MNYIFCCVFNQDKYVDMFYLLLESILTYGNLDDNTIILVYTSTIFMNRIKTSSLFNENRIHFEINDTLDTIDKACKARLDLFNLPSITNYNKILYLDTDIIVKDDINKVFDVCKEDILYVLEEGNLDTGFHDHHGRSLFGDELNNYEDKTAFTSGILLFNNCEKIKDLFNKINEDIINRPHDFVCCDQPYIVYNAFTYELYNNKILKSLVVNNDHNIHSDKVIHHFPGGPGIYQHKIDNMTIFLNNIKNKKQSLIEQIISNRFSMVGYERLENLYNQCKKFNNTNFSFVECGVAKGGCLAMMKFISGENNKIFGFDSFDEMPNITNEDISDYNKSCPEYWVGKSLCDGINSVYATFDKLKLDLNNVTLVKGFFQDTLQIQENIDNIGTIAVLRLDSDWYESTKICLEKLYDKVIDGGIIIIDDYGHFIGAKKATDEFRQKYNIYSPLIQTDYTEHYWIKKVEYIIQVGAHIGNTSNDYLYNKIKPNFTYIMIEPVPYLFKKLIENYKSYNNIIFLNIAISNYNGYIDLYIPSEKNDFTKLVSWCSQLASTNKDHIHTFVPECIVDKISIECKTLNTLIKEYNIIDLEYLYTDTEGHDYDILMDLDLSFIRPKHILFENKHMDGPKHLLDINNCPKYYNLLNHFTKYGYEVELQTGEDTCLKLFKTCNIEDDIWTCSSKMRYDIYNFFKDKSEFKIAEIGSHKGYSTKILSKIFSKVYAVDNSIEWTEFNKNLNKDVTNIDYVMLDIYKDSWNILPDDIEVSFIDANHSYECCKSDIFNSIKQFKNLQYIIFDDYGVWSGVKQIIDELIDCKIIQFERFIGLNNVPGPNGIVENINEGVICSVNKKYT